MQAALEFVFNLSLAGVTWSGALVAYIVSRLSAGQGFRFSRIMISLHILALTGGAITLGGVIGERPFVLDTETTFPGSIKVGGVMQWSFFLLALGFLAFSGFVPRALTPPSEAEPPTLKRAASAALHPAATEVQEHTHQADGYSPLPSKRG